MVDVSRGFGGKGTEAGGRREIRKNRYGARRDRNMIFWKKKDGWVDTTAADLSGVA